MLDKSTLDGVGEPFGKATHQMFLGEPYLAKLVGLLTVTDWLFLSAMFLSAFTYLPRENSCGVLSTTLGWCTSHFLGIIMVMICQKDDFFLDCNFVEIKSTFTARSLAKVSTNSK